MSYILISSLQAKQPISSSREAWMWVKNLFFCRPSSSSSLLSHSFGGCKFQWILLLKTIPILKFIILIHSVLSLKHTSFFFCVGRTNNLIHRFVMVNTGRCRFRSVLAFKQWRQWQLWQRWRGSRCALDAVDQLQVGRAYFLCAGTERTRWQK